MKRNYLKVAWRNLARQKFYSVINILGLALGLSVCMLIMLYVEHELSYDQFHKEADRIFALHEKMVSQGNTTQFATTSFITGPLVQQNIPAVSGYLRTWKPFKDVVIENPSANNARLSESSFLFTDANFFNFFSFKLLSGNKADVLTRPFSIIISKDMAVKYFGNADPIGKTLKIKTDSTYIYQISGVAENAPSNSSLKFDFLASNASLLSMKEAKILLSSQYVQVGSFQTYFSMKSPDQVSTVEHGIQSLSANDPNAGKMALQFSLIPLKNIHLDSKSGEFSNIKYIRIFEIVALLVLILSYVNYMSLITARSTLRAKEIGVRKVIGASRKNIAVQFYLESALCSSIAFIGGYGFYYLFKPWFLNILQFKIDDQFLYSPVMLSSMLTLLFATILIAGSYPVFILSSFNPVITLKGKMSKQAGAVTLRKVFTVMQFAISMGLVICGIVISRQLYYFKHSYTGINRTNVIMIPIKNGFGNGYQSFKNELTSLSSVSAVSTSRRQMYKGYDKALIHDELHNQNMLASFLLVDENFIPELGIKWQIQPVSKTELLDPKKVIINESTIAKLNLPSNPVGSQIELSGIKYKVSGVIKDFNFTSMEFSVDPLLLFVVPGTNTDWSAIGGGCLFAKLRPGTNIPGLISAIGAIYKKYNQETPFDYSFMDDAFNQQYKAEESLTALFKAFAFITLFLAAIGLLGLASFSIEQRTKEIAVRKILGANFSTIAFLLSKDFFKAVFLSIIIASPIAWWLMKTWLQSFAYRITIQWWMFAVAGLLSIIVAIVTISYHAIRAAVTNPVNSLKTE